MKIIGWIFSEYSRSLKFAFKDKFIFFLFWSLIIASLLILLLGSLAGRKRKKRLEEFSKKLNCSYTPTAKKDFIDSLGHFSLFARGIKRQVEDVFTMVWNGIPITIFYYSYFNLMAGDLRCWTTGIVAFSRLDNYCSSFLITPKSYLKILADFLGVKSNYHHFSFDSNPDFSGNFAVIGTDEGDIKKILTPRILDYIEKRRGINIEVRTNGILIYYLSDFRTPKRSPEDIKDFIHQASEIVMFFKEGYLN